MKKIKVGLIGFGLSGRFFHSPLMLAHGGYEVLALSTSRHEEAKSIFSNAKIASPEQILNDIEIELIINCAPNTFHYSYSAEALRNGKHVVVEKPFVNSVEEGEKLISLSEISGKTLTVFHNRRWDSDFLTIKKLLSENVFGEIKQFESHFDRWRPSQRNERWREQSLEGSGILFDLGSHLIDQALILFGKPQSVMADIEVQKPGGQSDDYFHIVFKYEKMRVILHSSSFSNFTPRFQIFGDKKSYIKYGLDPQEEQMKQGLSPQAPNFGVEEASARGQLHDPIANRVDTIPSEKGSYLQFYSDLYDHIALKKNTLPVTSLDALEVIRLIQIVKRCSELKTSLTV